jgi:hypothetical protein
MQETINGQGFRHLVMAGGRMLESHVQDVNALNVFPVPDGDTGSNMYMTFQSGIEAIAADGEEHIGRITGRFSKALLLGARGNSGVILSQLFRGFANEIEKDSEIDTVQFSQALAHGVQLAYQAVVKPVEGTILSVAKVASQYAVQRAKFVKSFPQLMADVVEKAEKALNRTPQQLPILKEVGVVDSGGQGLLYIYQGFLQFFKGESVSPVDRVEPPVRTPFPSRPVQAHIATDQIDKGYCTEFILHLSESAKRQFSLQLFRQKMGRWGDSLLVVTDDTLVKVHIHAERPGHVLNEAMNYGELDRIKIENMRGQHEHILQNQYTHENPTEREQKEAAKKPYGVVAAAQGAGLKKLFQSLGADEVIEGGQSKNPSAQEIAEAVSRIDAQRVYFLPNNGNIVLAGRQAAALTGVPLVVIPSKTVPQGLRALLVFAPEKDHRQIETDAVEALKTIRSGQITQAIKATTVNNVSINTGDYIGIVDGEIVISAPALPEALDGLIDRMVDDETEVLTIIAGEGSDPQAAEAVIQAARARYPDLIVEEHEGGQPLYPYIIASE